MDVLVPPLSTLALVATAGTASALLACWALDRPLLLAAAPWLLSMIFLAAYVIRGWALSGAGLRGLVDLCWAPVYVLWKLGLAMKRSGSREGEWVRTARARGDGDG